MTTKSPRNDRKPVTKNAKDVTKLPRIKSDNGDLFIVQQDERRIALGLIARGGDKVGKVGYFFRIELYDNAKDKNNLALAPEQAIWVKKFGYLHLRDGSWPIVGKLKGFTREVWPMPVFKHHDDELNIDYIRTYDENDVVKGLGNWRADQVPAYVNTSITAEDGAAGAVYVEEYLMEMLST